MSIFFIIVLQIFDVLVSVDISSLDSLTITTMYPYSYRSMYICLYLVTCLMSIKCYLSIAFASCEKFQRNKDISSLRETKTGSQRYIQFQQT